MIAVKLFVFLALIAFLSAPTLIGVGAAAYDSVETIPASGSPSQSYSPYYDADAGLELNYPRGWTVSAHPEKDCLAKFNGVIDGANGELRLSANSDPNVTASNVAKTYQLLLFSHLPNFKLVSEKNIAFGHGQKMRGVMDDITFEMNSAAVRQRYVFFDHGGKVVILTLTSPAQQFEKLVPTYNDMLLAVSPRADGRDHTASNQTADASAWQLTRLHSAAVPISFSYPSSWSVTQHPGDADRPLEITGKNSSGQPGAIAVYSGDAHPFATVEQAVADLEERHWKTQSQYHQTKQETITFGVSGRLDGVVHESAFVVNGQPMLQRVIFFRQGNRMVAFVFQCQGWKDNELNSLFHKMLATVETN